MQVDISDRSDSDLGKAFIKVDYDGKYSKVKREISPVKGLEWPRGFQEVKVPRFRDNGTGRW